MKQNLSNCQYFLFLDLKVVVVVPYKFEYVLKSQDCCTGFQSAQIVLTKAKVRTPKFDSSNLIHSTYVVLFNVQNLVFVKTKQVGLPYEIEYISLIADVGQ